MMNQNLNQIRWKRSDDDVEVVSGDISGNMIGVVFLGIISSNV